MAEGQVVLEREEIQLDPNKLMINEAGNALGYEKGTGFEEMTNFAVEVTGYVGDGKGNVVGYILKIILAVVDPLYADRANLSNQIYITNKELGIHSAISSALTKIPSLWIAQSKEPFLPQYVYNLCKSYIASDGLSCTRYAPVEVIGKQPASDVWVFNKDVHMDKNGTRIAADDLSYLLSEPKLPALVNVTGDFDNGEALKELIKAERDLFQNNFPQVIMCHVASGIASNYELVVSIWDGCATPVLKGKPISGKTTALRAALSVFGIHSFHSDCSSKFIEKKQSMTTIPFGWDDSSNIKHMKSISVNSFNAGGSDNVNVSYKPRTVPIITTNEECATLKIQSRWLSIPFEEPSPRLIGKDLMKAQKNLKSKMRCAHKSIGIMTAFIHGVLSHYEEDDEFDKIMAAVAEMIDPRAGETFIILLYCVKKVLEKLDLGVYYQEVFDKIMELVIPEYINCAKSKSATNSKAGKDAAIGSRQDLAIESLLKTSLPTAILAEDKQKALSFFDQEFMPMKCTCGVTVTFNVQSALDCIERIEEKMNGTSSQGSSITANAIRAFIRRRPDIGCTGGLQVKFRGLGKNQQLCACHIKRDWFDKETLQKLDDKLGKRGNTKQTTIGNEKAMMSQAGLGKSGCINNVQDEETSQTAVEVLNGKEDDPENTEITDIVLTAIRSGEMTLPLATLELLEEKTADDTDKNAESTEKDNEIDSLAGSVTDNTLQSTNGNEVQIIEATGDELSTSSSIDKSHVETTSDSQGKERFDNQAITTRETDSTYKKYVKRRKGAEVLQDKLSDAYRPRTKKRR